MNGILSPYRLTGIATPMAVWALHLVVVYSLQGVTCAESLGRARVAGMEPLAWWVVALTVAAFAVLAWLGRRAWQAWMAANTDRSEPVHAARRRFSAAITGALCVLSAVAILFTTIPTMLLPGCA